MARPRKFTDALILQALKNAKGLKALAAMALGCSLSTVELAAARNPKIAEEIRQQKETVLDLVEGKLYTAARNGEAWAICFLLKTQGKSRGYSERLEHTGGGGTPLVPTPQVRTVDNGNLHAVLQSLVESGAIEIHSN